MHGISFATRAPPQTLWGLISPHTPSVIRGGDGKEGDGKERGRGEGARGQIEALGPGGTMIRP